MDKIASRIAGEIALSENPGGTMKKWREIFKVSQAELAKQIGISPSTISDYESNRRESPGIKVVRRFVEALIEIDKTRGGHVVRNLQKSIQGFGEYFEAYEFSAGLTGNEFKEILNAKVVSGKEKLKQIELFGYTIVDSLKVILELPYDDFLRIYGDTNERALIFTNVSTGRSPMVAIKVAPIKPRIVVMHDLKKMDPLGLRIAKSLDIPILTTNMEAQKIRELLAKYV